jgi:NADH-quinone oxidoreductase subunit G
MVKIEGRVTLSAYSTPASESGMGIKANDERIIEIRKIIMELLLVNLDRKCTTCGKSETCQLQILASWY